MTATKFRFKWWFLAVLMFSILLAYSIAQLPLPSLDGLALWGLVGLALLVWQVYWR